MSNDVHLARVSKIQRSADMAKGRGETITLGRRFAGRNAKDCQLGNNSMESVIVCSHSSRSDLAGTSEIDSPEHTHRDNNESDNNISSCSTLDIGKVENVSVQQLEAQVRELTHSLENSEQENINLQRNLDGCITEKELCLRRLEVISAAHECRITEMHCVIAELSKKLRAKQETVILEEQEPEDSELSFQEDASVYNSELNLTNLEAESQTEAFESEAEHYNERCSNGENSRKAEVTDHQRINDVVGKGQVEALQEEILHLKAQIALLQSEIANAVVSPPEKNQSIELWDGTDITEIQSKNGLEAITQTHFVTPQKSIEMLSTPHVPPPVAKMAERIKLKCGRKSEQCQRELKTTSDLLNVEFQNADIAEYLVTDLKRYSKIITEGFSETPHMNSELKQLQRKIEHLKMRNTILSLTLDECKEHCEHLYLLCGKYESNAIALQSAVNCSDRAIEAYDVMLALLESKLALMTEKSFAADESRRAVETVARHLLCRLESEKNICENSLGPWQSTFSITDKVSIPWTADDDNRLRYHVSKLKGRRSTMQNTIVNLESPYRDLHEKSRLAFENGRHVVQNEGNAPYDLEIAVMMQELLNLREENINLKSRIESAETDIRHANERNSLLEEALQQLQSQLQLQNSTDTNRDLFHREQLGANRVSYSESEHVALTEQHLVEALTRESELKNRIQTLIASVAASHLSADEKHIQMKNNIQELRKSNLNLTQLLDQNKRRYQVRVRRLEQKIMEMSLEPEQKWNRNMEYNSTGSSIVSGDFGRKNIVSGITMQLPQRLKSKTAPESQKSLESRLQAQENMPETTL